MTEIQLMATAKSNYDDLVEAWTWLQKDDTKKQLVAFTAQLEQIEIKHKNLQKDNQVRQQQVEMTVCTSQEQQKQTKVFKDKT